jgi:F0F1-type ATP synthase assembly protein I
MAVVLFCLFNVLCLWLLLKDFDFSRLFNVLVLSFYVYYFFSFVNFFTGNNILGYKDRYVETEMWLLVSFLVGLIIAKWLFRRKAVTETPAFAPPPLKGILFSAHALIISGLLLYALFVYRAYGGIHGILATTDRYELYQKKRGLGSLFIGLNICFVGTLMRMGYYILYRKTIKQTFPLLAVVITLVLLAFQYVNSERSNMLFFLLPFTILCLCRRRRLNYYLLLLAPFALLLMQVVAVKRVIGNPDKNQKFTQYYHNQRLLVFFAARLLSRNTSESYSADNANKPASPSRNVTPARVERSKIAMEQLNNVLDIITITRQSSDLSKHGEFITPGKVDMKVAENLGAIEKRYGATYIDVMLNLPPAWLVPHRPLLPAEWFVKTFYPEEARQGGGLGFSIISEALINFSFAGPFIYGLVCGLLLLFFERKLTDTPFYYLIVYCVLGYYVFIMLRSGVAGVIKPAIVSVILPVFVVRAASKYFSKPTEKPAIE